MNTKSLKKCAEYILETELENFTEFIMEDGNVPMNHVYAIAYVGLYGKKSFAKRLKSLLYVNEEN